MSEVSQSSSEAAHSASVSPTPSTGTPSRPVQRRADPRLAGDFAAQERALSPAAAAQRKGGPPKSARLGKPSMFYLLAFKDNVCVADNREQGVTAGSEPELQTTNMPAQAFLMGNLMVKA